MFCVLRILHRCVFRSKSFHGFPGALPDKSGSSGDCQTLQIFFGSVGRCLWNLPVFLVFKRNQYGEHTHFFSWDLLCDGPAGLRFPQREGTAFRSLRLLWHVFLLGGILHVLPPGTGKGILIFFTITFTAYWILNTGIRLFKYLKGKAVPRCQVILETGGQKVELKGLLDTGNCLRDMDTGKPVCVMEKNRFSGMLEKKQQEALEKFCRMEDAGEEEIRGMNPRYLPYTALGCERGILPVITADRLELFVEGRKISVPQPAIGLSSTPLSPYKNFEMIISPKILES